jgi:hypothetical protein
VHLSFALTIVAIPVLLFLGLGFFARGRWLAAIFAVVAALGCFSAAAQGHGSCVSTVQSASSACATTTATTWQPGYTTVGN